MKIVYMGTPEFASPPLERLYNEGYDIVAVFTQPDKRQNRGMKVSCSPVKELALKHGTPVCQPSTLKDGKATALLRDFGCDILVVVAYGKMLPLEMLSIAPLGAVNIHGSLLPHYRGAAPIQWAVINGETETGLTSMYISEQMDAGDVLLYKKTAIEENETAGELHNRLSIMGAELLSDTLKTISRGEALPIPQDHSKATYAPPLTKEMSPIDWAQTAPHVKNRIRGLNPWPVATMELGGQVVKVFKAEVSAGTTVKAAGEIVSAGKFGIQIACGDGSIIIKELQTAGGKRMQAAEFVKGHSLGFGDIDGKWH